MSNKFLTFRMSPSNAVEKLAQWRSLVSKSEFKKAINKIERDGIKILKSKTPVRTGRLRNSMTTIKKDSISGGGIDLRSGIVIGSRLPYANYVDQGVKQSSGRYVPALGRRITTGIHPGFRPRNFVSAAKPLIDESMKRTLEKFTSDWGRKLRL
jgi:hypothetical protein